MFARSKIQKGQLYRTLEPIPVRYLIHWRAPFTGGGSGTLPAGETLVVRDGPSFWSSLVTCDAERAGEIETLLVPEADRKAEKYAGYTLFISLETIRSRCLRVDAS
jgi:hypothetical protein